MRQEREESQRMGCMSESLMWATGVQSHWEPSEKRCGTYLRIIVKGEATGVYTHQPSSLNFRIVPGALIT